MGTGLQVGHLVRGGLLTCEASLSLGEAAQRMFQARVSCILVVEHDEICGIWSEGDARRLDFADRTLLSMPISRLMSSPVVRIAHDTDLNEAALLMKRKRLRRLLVEDGEGCPLGMLTLSDIVREQGMEYYLTMRDVGSTVMRPPLILQADLALDEAVTRLREANVDAAVIDYGEQSYGILTERDLIAALAGALPGERASDVCSRNLLSVPYTMGLVRAVTLLRDRDFRHLGVQDAKGRLCGLLSYADIVASIEYEVMDQLKEALAERDHALRASSEHLRLAQRVINASVDGIIITDAHGIIQSVNPSFTTLTGYSAEEAVGKTPGILSSGRQDGAFYRRMWSALLEQDYWQGEIWNRRKNGEIYPEWLTITAIRDDEGELQQFAAIFSDISDRKRQEAQIHRLAYFDDLTGLANRRLFLDRLGQALASAHRHQHRMAVLFLDLDLFKRINDTLGHHIGDQVLRDIARRLQVVVGEGESVARLGGDEFTILVPELTDPADLERLSERLIVEICRPLDVLGHQLGVSTSIGISVYPEDGDTPERLLKHADTAMYRAKESGRNQFRFYTSNMGQHNRQALTLEHSLRRALDAQALELVYQPKVSLIDGRLTGFEALLRWNDPELGVVSPAQFIPLAEKLGMIERIGSWVLDRVCEQQQAWVDLPRVPIAVNVSASQLSEERFVDALETRLSEHELESSLLELELTESCLIPDHSDVTQRVLQRLRALGVRLSVDDFGTGYSSLSYLRRLPINTLKIDACFVHDLPNSREDSQIIRAMIAMADALGLEVVAEGVETAAQVAFLREEGCATGQGYWLSRPLDAAQARHWLVRHASAEDTTGASP
ncbi:EAL domain-containing protein [Halomonas shantousis]